MSRSIASPTTREGKLTAGLESRDVRIPPVGLAGTLRIPRNARAFIAFAHGSSSSRFSPRNMAVAEGLNARELGTLLFDLLTWEEEADRANVFNVTLLAERFMDSVIWLDRESPTSRVPSAYSARAPEQQLRSWQPAAWRSHRRRRLSRRTSGSCRQDFGSYSDADSPDCWRRGLWRD
jgi:hypothetical protein